MKYFISGWILILLSIAAAISYILLAKDWGNNPITFGLWSFPAGFFIVGALFIALSCETKPAEKK